MRYMIVLLIFLSSPAFAFLTPNSEAHWCLIDKNGTTPPGCTGPKLNGSETNINYFLKDYQGNPTQWRAATYDHQPRIVPLISEDTSHTPVNMLPLNVIKAVYHRDPATQNYGFAAYTTHWRYLNKVVIFGGSDSEGQILLPTPGWIRTAHQKWG